MARPQTALLLSILLLLGACAGPERILDQPEPPPLRFEPEGAPRLRILALHGFNDHATAFDEFGRWASSQGASVVAYDQSGFGARPNRGYWGGSEALTDEVLARLSELTRAEPRVPVYVLGESMGAAVALLALTRPDAPRPAGVILTAPAVWGGDTLNPFARVTLWLADHLLPGLTLTGRGLGIQASDNIEMLRALGRDPLYIKATRVDAIAGLVALMDAARAAGPRLDLPTLVLVGARDQVVRPEIQESFAADLLARPCTLVHYGEGWHLLLRDLQRQTVWRDILAWAEAEPLPSGGGRPCRPEVSAGINGEDQP